MRKIILYIIVAMVTVNNAVYAHSDIRLTLSASPKTETRASNLAQVAWNFLEFLKGSPYTSRSSRYIPVYSPSNFTGKERGHPFNGMGGGESGGNEGGDICPTCGAGTELQGGQCIVSFVGGGNTGNGGASTCADVNKNTRHEAPYGKCDDAWECNPTGYQSQTCVDSNGFCQSCRKKCLSEETKIETPTGFMSIKNLKIGDQVYTRNAEGKKIITPILITSKVPVSNHKVAHLVLIDGRSLDVSALHPTAHGNTVGDLKAGDQYDGSIVKSVVIIPYIGSATYDLLPAGDTGYYWANGILMGSTLK